MKKHGWTIVIVKRRKVINWEGQSLSLFYFWLVCLFENKKLLEYKTIFKTYVSIFYQVNFTLF